MIILPIILMCNYCSFFCFLHHFKLWTTKQALTAMPDGLVQGSGVCMAVGTGPFLQDNWQICWEVK
uniref:Uncharacterized protein n=1 Tax=Theropithecus gelada TaxID=9565 RepID=A0A8D2E8C4_THEGE